MVQGRTRGSGRRAGTFRVLALLVAALLVAACSGDDNRPSPSAPAAAAEGLTELGRRLPQRIRTAREIRVGSDVSYAPVEFSSAFAPDVLDRPVGEPEPEVRGIDPDLAAELGRRLGPLTFVNTASTVIPHQGRHFDVIISRYRHPERTGTYFSSTSRQRPSSVPIQPERVDSLPNCAAPPSPSRRAPQESWSRPAADCGDRRIKATRWTRHQVVLEGKVRKGRRPLCRIPVPPYNAKVSARGRNSGGG